MLKHSLTTSDIFLIIVNLVPLYGVWFMNWDAAQMFLIYCMESVIIGMFQVVKLLVLSFFKRSDVWNEDAPNASKQPGWLFIIFFILHYGFFVFVQVSIFISVGSISKTVGQDVGAFDLIFHFTNYLQPGSLIALLLFTAAYAIVTVKDFFITGQYKTASMGVVMFQPYLRIVVQQFVVIIGSLFLSFGASKIFMLVFVVIKIFFEILLPYSKVFDAQLKKLKQQDV